ncbi:6-phospho-3-hexuloisomerase [Luxibacter massiliensis]|uniref:6-phospho-3-hexuloisomerase n=1 Tax=Luxibacter massiliensis TaxID=2219695 RepID=UPI000F060897|nr:6-phospho-3-hexuloisomerase [Luxibacter massiliensis]
MAEAVVLKKILEELMGNAELIQQEELEGFADRIEAAQRIFVAGAGRSGFVARAFSNRLMHLGLTVYFVGEPTTPSIQAGDLLIIASGSGETGSLKVMAQKAKKQGALVATITIFPEASIGSMADAVIKVPGITPKSELKNDVQSVQPMGNAFEQTTWLICDNIIMILMERFGKTAEDMFKLHANLE